MKNERGITLLSLIITVIIMAILISASLSFGLTSVAEMKLQNFSYELQQIQGRVDNIYERMVAEGNPNYITVTVNGNKKLLGWSITYSDDAVNTFYKLSNETIWYKDLENQNDPDLYIDYAGGKQAMYRYFSKEDLEETLDVKNAKQDVIINFKTREVISVEGITYKDKIYYTRPDV